MQSIASEAPRVAGAPRPFLKWAGGKTQLLPELRRRVVESFDVYHEPFLGGGALFFSLRPRQARLSDLNEDLISCYRVVKNNVEALIRRLRQLQTRTDEESFYRIRGQDPAKLSVVARAARLIYLNKTCYNGLHRVNRQGRFNVPYGRYNQPIVCDPANLRAVSGALQSAELHVGPFEAVLERARPGDFIYFDPPYHPLSSTASFTSYAQEDFGEVQQRQLAEVFRELDQRRCKVLLSNSDTALVRELYRGFGIETVWARRAINSRGERRGQIAELVVRNYE